MLETFLVGFQNVLVLFIFVFAGVIIRRLKIVEKNFASQLSKVIFNFFLPCMLIDIIFNSLDIKMVVENYSLLIVSIALIFAGVIIGIGVWFPFRKKCESSSIFSFAFAFPNFVFMGFPVVEALYGKKDFGLLLIYCLPLYFLVNILGYMVLASEKKINLKKVFNPSTIAMILGFLLLAFNVELPYVGVKVVSYASNVVSPLAMFSAGLVIGDCNFIEMLKDFKVYIISAIRLIIIPLTVLAVLLSLGFSGGALYIPVIISGMPVAANMTIIAGAIGKNEKISAQIIFVSTALSLVTIPFLSGIITLFTT